MGGVVLSGHRIALIVTEAARLNLDAQEADLLHATVEHRMNWDQIAGILDPPDADTARRHYGHLAGRRQKHHLLSHADHGNGYGGEDEGFFSVSDHRASQRAAQCGVRRFGCSGMGAFLFGGVHDRPVARASSIDRGG